MALKIIGFGNILMRDDGVGVYVINELEKLPEFKNDKIKLIDGSVFALNLFEELNHNDKIIIIDAINTKTLPPGSVYKFNSKEVKELIVSQGQYLSLHDINIAEILKFILEKEKIELTFIGIEIKEIKHSIGLSEDVEHAIPEVINIVKQEIKNYFLEKNYDCNPT